MQVLFKGERPSDYVKVQRAVNTSHKDGFKWHADERVRDKIQVMCGLLTLNKIKIDNAVFIGCRMGCEMLEFQSRFPLVTMLGVDVVKEFVEETKERAGDAIVADAHELPFADNSYDLLFSAQTLEHCYDPALAVSEFMRVAKKVVHLSLPLENKYTYDLNPSHHAYVKNPIGWVRMFEPYPLWRLQWAGITERNTFDIMMVYIGSEYERF